jgi:hypothetical protein
MSDKRGLVTIQMWLLMLKYLVEYICITLVLFDLNIVQHCKVAYTVILGCRL